MRRLTRFFWFLLALVFLFEAWIWERLAPVVGWIVARIPLAALKAAMAAGIARLPPYATLLVFAIPALILFPFKLAGLWLIGKGHLVLGTGVFLLAKTVGLAVTAFLFETCKPKLMQLRWFVRLHDWLLRVRAWAHAQTEPARRMIRAIRARIGGQRSRLLALLMRIRRRSWRRAGS